MNDDQTHVVVFWVGLVFIVACWTLALTGIAGADASRCTTICQKTPNGSVICRTRCYD